ncbi:MAG TPA: ABC transporter permease [Solirubrobacteraceae bacterium]|nr:ABC transporter permease [Solirubrobacteraceae bacterium]
MSRAGVRSVYAVEVRKLSSQLAIRLLALVCLLAPFLFGAILKVQSGSPTDTLYGVWVHSSGFALSLVMLAFAGSWGLPLVAAIVSGDLFSAEDRYGTWKLVLTRSATRGEVFAGKLLAAATFTLALAGLAAVASLVAGAALVGPHALVSLSGSQFSAGKVLLLVAVSWLLCLLPTLAFASLAILLSIASRNGIVGVVGPALAALAMQLLLLVGSGIWAHMLLVSSAFTTWRALFTDHPYYGQLAIGVAVSLAWIGACTAASWLILRKRDFAGTPVVRRQGWAVPLRAAVAISAVIALFAVAGNWGPAGATPTRLKASFIPAFSNLTILQQQELGRNVPPGAKLNFALPSCSRRGSTPNGPGDWVCTINVLIPTPGSLPPQPTPVSYDISVQWDGCYKAQSPPAFIGQQLMRDAGGAQLVNPLYTIYGCFNTL